ncbi:MAG: TIGR03936 family radical SAM-associated protein [Chloroflexota bacterium]|nr:TIGR03936 family radical SAM-associated protein [Chloroflexota bacterium]
MNTEDLISRIRVQYTKGHNLRFTGHLDMQRIWERLLRRSGLPVRYSQGFHPRARLNLASALPLGFISEAELLDFWMNEPLSLKEIQAKLVSAAPPDLEIKKVDFADLHEKSLQSQMSASEFEIQFFEPQDPKTLQEKINSLLNQDAIIRIRRKKTYDLLPLILNLDIFTHDSGEIGLKAHLKAEPGATGRPDEILDEIGYANTEYVVKRTQLILSTGNG